MIFALLLAIVAILGGVAIRENMRPEPRIERLQRRLLKRTRQVTDLKLKLIRLWGQVDKTEQ